MNVEPMLAPSHSFELQPSPQLLQFVELLALPALELEQRIERELAFNPALECVEKACCRLCGLVEGECECRLAGSRPAEGVTHGSSDFDFLSSVAERTSPSERLLAEASTMLAPAERLIAEYIVGSLDDRGILPMTVDEAAAALEVDPHCLRKVLAVLREVGPPYLGARDVRECLLLQLQQLEKAEGAHPIAVAIVADHLEEASQGRWGAIAEAIGESEAHVIEECAFIRERLRPSTSLDDFVRPLWESAVSPPRLIPDVVIRVSSRDPGQIEAFVPDGRQHLTVEPLYQRLSEGPVPIHWGSDVQRHARLWVQRANNFIELVERRDSTVRRIAGHLAKVQTPFVMAGPAEIRPLRRSDVARELGLHESTVSRAIAGKLALLPSGHFVPLSQFFPASLPVENALRQLLAGERRKPSDRELAARLGGLGYVVARRTVAKYRSRLLSESKLAATR
jgi:RNA polymerase sigma-54 factor